MSARRALAAALLVSVTLAAAASLRWHPPAAGGLAPAEPAARQLDAEVTRQFGMELPIAWLVVARGGSVWTPVVLSRVQVLTRAVFALPGVIAPEVVSVASPNLREVSVTEGSLAPRYLMGEVPRDEGALAELRARVDGDPLLRGNLVSLDGAAALVAANFRPTTDTTALAAAALALRDRFRDEVIDVFVVGAPTMAASARASLRARLPGALALGITAVVAGVAFWSLRRLAAAGAAAIASAAVTAAAAAWLAAPAAWAALAAAGAAAIAGVLGLRRLWPARMVAASASVTALALVVAVVLAMPALQAYLAALALGVLVAPCAVTCARAAFGVPDAERGRWRWSSHVIALVVAGAALGVARLDVRLDIAGYGLRYLPSPARDDLAAMARYLPPPQSFAIRVRGEPGFVTRPDVLGAFARITAAAREDPAVRAASSLADLVARVHRVFNDDRPELERVPDDRALIGRYLALAYSPGFRRFVDRPLATAAIWVDLDSTAPSDALRVHRLLTDALAAHPVPQATVDPPAGDAMALVRSMRAVVALARAGVGVLALSAIGLVPLLGAIGAAHALAVAALSTAAAAGCLGWVGGALDLVTVPGLLAVAVAGLLGGAVTAAGRRAEIGAGRKAV